VEATRPEDSKRRSRGASRDMSPAAISRRFDILVELHELWRTLSRAKRLGRVKDARGSGGAGRPGASVRDGDQAEGTAT
jgi:hypothetical protein